MAKQDALARRGASRVARCLAALAAACVVALPASAAMYKWVDASGRTVYSDQPPPDGNAERFKTSVAPADPSAVRDLAAKDAELRKRQQQRADDAAKADKSAADAKRKNEWCTQARAQNKNYLSNRNLARVDEKGEMHYLDDAERAKVVATNEKAMRDMGCPES